MKRTFATILVVLLLATTLVVPAYANSAQTHWRGVDSTGAVVVDGNCPIEVTKEVLTFDISEFPDNYYREIEDYRAIINKRASEGWRYVGYIPTKQRGTGHTQELDLIFEKEV